MGAQRDRLGPTIPIKSSKRGQLFQNIFLPILNRSLLWESIDHEASIKWAVKNTLDWALKYFDFSPVHSLTQSNQGSPPASASTQDQTQPGNL